MVFYVYAKGNMAGDCAALGLWIYLRDSRLLNITQNAGFFGSIEKQKIFCKSKVSVRKIYSGTKDSHDVMSWESFWCARWAHVLTGESPQSARQWEGYSRSQGCPP